MKKKRKHPSHTAHKGRRNAVSASAGSAPRARTSRLPRRGAAPPWKSIVAAVAGGAGGAALGGLVVNQKILSEEAVGLGLMLGGGTAAYLADGNTRVVGTAVAAAGAGQLALALMTKHAVKQQDNGKGPAHGTPPSAPAPPAPPPPPLQLAPPPPRKSATGGGVVLDLFRDAVTDLDTIEDEWRYGTRDAAEPIVIDLDQAA